MDTDHEIAVASSDTGATSLSKEAATLATNAPAASGKATKTQVSEEGRTKTTSPKALAAAAEAAAVAANGSKRSASRSSSPLSDVDEDVLQTAPTNKLRKLATGEEKPSATSKSPAVKSTRFVNLSSTDFTSSPASTRKRAHASSSKNEADAPTPKRQDRPPKRKSAPKQFSFTSLDGAADEEVQPDLSLLDNMVDDLATRPTKKAFMSGGSGMAGRRKTRLLDGSVEDDNSGGGFSSRLRNREVEKEVDVEYEPLHLYEGSSWVLFDPIKSFPSSLPPPPDFLHRYAHYEPGNDRILEHNLVSNSVRLKWTPKVLQGRPVSYGEHGPRFEE